MAAAGALAAIALMPAGAGAGGELTITVEPGGLNAFAPDEAQTVLGVDTFAFHWEDPPTDDFHNVVQDDGLFTSGPTIEDREDYLVEASAGTYEYYCVAHADPHSNDPDGMDGRIAVEPTLFENPPPPEGTFRPAWATDITETGDRFDVRFKVGDGKWRMWKDETSKFKALFGRNGSPAEVKPGKQYRLQARSQKGSNTSKRSRWSPPLVVST